MKWLVFIAGLIDGAGGTFATVVYAHMNWEKKDDTIIFPMKVFYEHENDGRVFISGTLTGPGVGYPNNTYTISCVKDEHECSISHIDQIGTNLIGRLEVAYNIPIVLERVRGDRFRR